MPRQATLHWSRFIEFAKGTVQRIKSYIEYEDVIDYIKEIKDKIRTDIEVVMCPSTIFIPYFNGKYNFSLGTINSAYGYLSDPRLLILPIVQYSTNYTIICLI